MPDICRGSPLSHAVPILHDRSPRSKIAQQINRAARAFLKLSASIQTEQRSEAQLCSDEQSVPQRTDNISTTHKIHTLSVVVFFILFTCFIFCMIYHLKLYHYAHLLSRKILFCYTFLIFLKDMQNERGQVSGGNFENSTNVTNFLVFYTFFKFGVEMEKEL